MAVLNYADLYLQALQQIFKAGLRFGNLYSAPNNATIRWVNAKTIQIPNIETGGFTDVDRDVVGGYTRRVDNKWIPLTLEHDREFRTLVDPVDVDETNMAITIANVTRVFNTEHKIPEMDKYMASKLFAEATRLTATIDKTALTTANILSKFDDLMEQMDEAEVPNEGRELYVTPAIQKLLKEADSIQRQLDIGGRRGNDINRSIYSLDDVTIIPVPSSRMKTAYDFTDGAVPAGSAKQIHMILIHPDVVLSPQKYEFVSLDSPSATTGGKYLYYERKYWDVFIIEPKSDGIALVVEGP